MRTYIFFISLFSCITLHAQNTEWAARVIRFSTEYNRKQYGSVQVLGKPDKLPAWGESAVAWAPKTMDNPGGEFIEVGFDSAMQIRQVAIGESNCPGAIAKIILISDEGKKYIVYQNDTITPRFTSGGGMFHCIFPETAYRVQALKLILNTQAIPGMNQIDCIGISDASAPVEAAIHTTPDEEKIPPAENLGPLVNSTADDMLPIISPDGKTLYFARKKYAGNTGDEKRDDIYFCTLDSAGNWSPAQNIGPPLNNELHNYLGWISPDGQKAFVANNYATVKQDISVSYRTANGWSVPKALKINDYYNKNEFSDFHANTEGTVLLMAIEREDTYGDMDIYVSFLQKNGVWTEPKNIGPDINTAATEGCVFIAADNKTIYFTSNGRSGYGGFDMFMSRRLDDTWMHWSEPVNLGPQINSKYDDFYYTIPANGEYAYFSSSADSYGKADLYRIRLPHNVQPEPVTLIHGTVVDAETHKPLDAEIDLGAETGISPRGEEETMHGSYQIVLPASQYPVTIKKQGYFPYIKNEEDASGFLPDYNTADSLETVKRRIIAVLQPEMETHTLSLDSLRSVILEKVRSEMGDSLSAQNDTVTGEIISMMRAQDAVDTAYSETEENISLIPLREGEVSRMNNIYFEANKADLRPESCDALDAMVQFLLDNPKIYVEIGGHTNGLPDEAFCNKLSEDRANAVSKYFIDHGVPSARVTAKGYGKSMPVADDSTLEGRRKNQRVELKIIRIE